MPRRAVSLGSLPATACGDSFVFEQPILSSSALPGTKIVRRLLTFSTPCDFDALAPLLMTDRSWDLGVAIDAQHFNNRTTRDIHPDVHVFNPFQSHLDSYTRVLVLLHNFPQTANMDVEQIRIYSQLLPSSCCLQMISL